MKLTSSFYRTQTAVESLYARDIKKRIEMRSCGISAREINAYEYSAESFGLARTGRVNSVEPVEVHFKPQLLLHALNMCHLLYR